MGTIRAALGAIAAALLLAGCGAAGGDSAPRTQIRAVGSSTVYPFTTAVAEQFAREDSRFHAPIVESTGTGAGMKLFCAGVGPLYPDIENASRKIKEGEVEDCNANGVRQIIEIQIGIDGIALAQSPAAQPVPLTLRHIYSALAATPFGRPNRARLWSEIDPALPATPIQIYGPPPTSGTRDALVELIMTPGCESDHAMKALKESDEDRHKSVCQKVREDGVFVEAGENDNLIAQKVTGNPGAIGIFGYSFLEENAAALRPLEIDGVAPTIQTITAFDYPGARPLYIYVKGEHLGVIPGLREFVAEYGSALGPDTYLARRGLIAAPGEIEAAAKRTAADPLGQGPAPWTRGGEGQRGGGWTLPILLALVGLGGIAWLTGRARVTNLARQSGQRPHSLPSFHGWYVALWALIPPLLFLAAWSFIAPGLNLQAMLSDPAAAALPSAGPARDAAIGEARAIAQGSMQIGFSPQAQRLADAYSAAADRHMLMAGILAIILAFAGGAFAFTRARPDFRARLRVERGVMAILLGASMVAVLTTFGIVASLLFESMRFFSMVSPAEFLFGTQWSPQTAIRADQAGSSGAFGAIPLFWGTIFIGAIIAMLVAIPLGLMSAIYLTQYARQSVRRWMKPLLEVLAGVPTVVYGYFAALTIAPAIRDVGVAIGISGASSESALAAGLVMGVMIIPFVSSMADDSINAVPQAMRDGSLAMGATTSETIKQVLVPAALPGVVGGVLLAVSRAIGETMIVVMAAGLAANLTANPFASVTTVTTQIVQLLTGDQEFDSPKTLAAFALGLVLFIVTLLLNIVALRVVRKYREAYE